MACIDVARFSIAEFFIGDAPFAWKLPAVLAEASIARPDDGKYNFEYPYALNTEISVIHTSYLGG